MSNETVLLTPLSLYNLGCEGIFRGTVAIIRERVDEDAEFIMPSYYVESDRARLDDLEGCTIVPMSAVRGIRRKVLRVLGLFTSGLWTPRFPPRVLTGESVSVALSVGGDMYTLYNDDLPWDLVKMGDYVHKRALPYVIWGASMESFERRPDLLPRLITHLKSCELITVRDHRTLEYLRGHGVSDNVKEVYDPAFCMNPMEFDIEEFLPGDRSDMCIGLNTSPLSARTAGRDDMLKETIRTVEGIIEQTGQSVLLVPHVFAPTPMPQYDDLAWHQAIHDGIGAKYKSRVGVVSRDIGAPRMKYLLSHLSAYCGARMHSTIAAMSTCVPTVLLAYSEKAYGLSGMIFGDEEWVLPIGDFTAEKCMKKVVSLLDRREEVHKYLESKIPTIRAKSAQAGDHLAGVLRRESGN
jgi:polysaccharide pyruvyl transferase WcaK-like protein